MNNRLNQLPDFQYSYTSKNVFNMYSHLHKYSHFNKAFLKQHKKNNLQTYKALLLCSIEGLKNNQ